MIRNKQVGSTSVTSTESTVTLSGFTNLAKMVLIVNGAETDDVTNIGGYISSKTALKLKGDVSTAHTCRWVVVEYS